MEFRNKVALVTGGASGLGEATVRRLAAAGNRVVVLDLNRERGAALAQELGEAVAFFQADISRPDQVKAAVEFTVERFGRIDILVNCAAIGIAMKTADPKKGMHDLDLFKKVVEINLVGTFDVIRNAANAMLQNELNEEGGRGVIISTASVAAFEGQIGQVAYAATKAGVVGITLPIARDLAPYGIRVCTIAPGIFDTPMLGQLPENVREALGRMIPFPQRLGRPEEFAMLVQQIVENGMLNGEVIRLDGAIRMQPR